MPSGSQGGGGGDEKNGVCSKVFAAGMKLRTCQLSCRKVHIISSTYLLLDALILIGIGGHVVRTMRFFYLYVVLGLCFIYLMDGLSTVGGFHVSYALEDDFVFEHVNMPVSLDGRDIPLVHSEDMFDASERFLYAGVTAAVLAPSLPLPLLSVRVSQIFQRISWILPTAVAALIIMHKLPLVEGVDSNDLMLQYPTMSDDPYDAELQAFYKRDIELHQTLRDSGPEEEKRYVADLQEEEQSIDQELKLLNLELVYEATDKRSQKYIDLHVKRNEVLIMQNYLKRLLREGRQRQETYQKNQSLSEWREAIDYNILHARKLLHGMMFSQ